MVKSQIESSINCLYDRYHLVQQKKPDHELNTIEKLKFIQVCFFLFSLLVVFSSRNLFSIEWILLIKPNLPIFKAFIISIALTQTKDFPTDYYFLYSFSPLNKLDSYYTILCLEKKNVNSDSSLFHLSISSNPFFFVFTMYYHEDM